MLIESSEPNAHASITRAVEEAIAALNSELSTVVVAIDGRSGSGKSTLAARLAPELGAVVIAGDDFYRGGVEIRSDGPASRADACIDWRCQRQALRKLRAAESASWAPFDWQAFDGSCARDVVCEPTPVVLLEGVYSARPQLEDVVDVRILVDVAEDVRMRQLLEREGEIGPWERQWLEAEDYYFGVIVLADDFDLVVDPSKNSPG